MLRKSLKLVALVTLLAACDSTAPERPGQVAVRFSAANSSASSALQPAGARIPTGASFDHVPGTNPLTITGGDDTLVIHDLRLIVSEIELERSEGACLSEEDSDDCEEFEGGPFLVNLLDGSAVEVVTAVIPAGSYTEFEFEVENLDIDEGEDDEEQRVKQSILAELRETYPAFPSNASMVVHGTFNGEPFTVYFDAEIEVEQEFATPFRVPEDGAVLVNLDPAAWFKVGEQVLDLSALDGRTVEFEFEFKSGVKIDHDDD